MRVLFAEYGHQDVGAGHFLFAGGLDVQNGALDYALEAQRGLGIDLVLARHLGRMLFNELAELVAHRIEIGATGAQHLGCRRIVQHRHQQMLHRNEFVAFLSRIHEGHVQRDFEFLGDHLNFPPSYIAADADAAARNPQPARPWYVRYPSDISRTHPHPQYAL